MPYPILLLAGAALSAAGAGAEAYGVQQTQSAMNKAVDEEVAQQQQYAQKGRNLFESSLSSSSPNTAQQQMQQGQQRARSEYERLQALDLQQGKTPFQSDPSALKVDAGRIQQSNTAQANLQGYSEWDLQQAIKNLQTSGQLGVLNRFAQGTARVLPYSLQNAQQAGSTAQGIGSLLSAAGSLVGGYGALTGGAGALSSIAGEALPTAGASYMLNQKNNLFAPIQPGYPGAEG